MSNPSSASTSLTKRPASGLMPPPPAPKRIKRPAIVLDEDTYASAISHIVRRDYFPGLAQTDAQSEYLNALESKDNAWIREAGKKLTQAMTPVHSGHRRPRKRARGSGDRSRTPAVGAGGGETPSTWGADTPVTLLGTEIPDAEGEEKKPEVDLTLSLTAFQAKYTSEDQESFSRILDRQNAKKFSATEWLRTGNRHPSRQRIAQQKILAAETPSQSTATSSTSAVTLRPSQDLDARPAAPTTHKHTPFNPLMFPPDSIESWAPTRAQLADAASLAPPKIVLTANTRLPVTTDDPPRPPSPTMSAVRDAIRGNPRFAPSELDGDGDGSETPRVGGYGFVGDDEEEEEEEAPKDLLERFGARGSGMTFEIPEEQRREKLHFKMVDRIAAKKNEGPKTSGLRKGVDTPRFLSAPTPRAGGMTPGRKAGGLTPAGQRLLERVGGGTPGRREGGFGGDRDKKSGLGREWTPTPRVRRRV